MMKTNDRINALADRIDSFVTTSDVEGLMKLLRKAKIADLLVLHYLNMGVSGVGNHWAIGYIEDVLNEHFSEGGSYL